MTTDFAMKIAELVVGTLPTMTFDACPNTRPAATRLFDTLLGGGAAALELEETSDFPNRPLPLES
jgi:hypothetical protein